MPDEHKVTWEMQGYFGNLEVIEEAEKSLLSSNEMKNAIAKNKKEMLWTNWNVDMVLHINWFGHWFNT